MRYFEAKIIDTLLSTLENGVQPDTKLLAKARKAIDRELGILGKRAERSADFWEDYKALQQLE